MKKKASDRLLTSICLPGLTIFLIIIFMAVSLVLPASAQSTAPGKNKIIVAGEIDYPPYSFLDQKGEPTGFQVELTQAIARTMGMDVEIRLGPWPEVRRALERGDIDVIPGMFYSEERAKIFDFSPPFAIVSEAIFARKNSPSINSVEDLRGKELIVMRGEAMHDYILQHRLTDRILLAETPADALRLLASGKGDYALGAQMPGFYWIRELKLSNIATVGPSLEPFKNCFAVQKGNTELLSRFTEGLHILNQTGEYQEISDKWLGVLEPNRIKFKLAIKYAAAVILPLIALLAVFVVWSWLLRSRVNQKTKELRDKSEELERYFTSSLDLLCIANTDGHFIRLNPEWEKLLGYSLADLEGRKFIDLVHPDDRDNTLAAIAKLDEQREVLSFENRYLCQNGEWRWIEWRSRPQGKMIYAAARDITARKQAEEERINLEERLNRAEKMEALGLLAGGVAHDLNNVIGIMVGYAELIADEVDNSSPLRKDLLSIVDAGNRASAIVQDLLTLARRGVTGRKALNVNRLILDFVHSPDWEKMHTHHPSVQLKTHLENDLLNISASPVHLQKTLYNLVSNASEAMPEGGLIEIKTTNQYLDKAVHGYDQIREGDYVVLSVSDTGEGISDEDLKHIFEPFYTKKIMGRSGTGLGLAVVWGTVKDHSGYIDVQSIKGQGSIFTIYIPVTREDVVAPASAVAMSEYMGNGETILVVDDVQGQRELATAMLKKLNYQVVNVASGEEALEYLKKNKADLLVLDMIMDPGMDGLDTYRSILNIHPRQKAVIVSGFSETHRVNATQALGAGDYVKKPYVLEKLGMAVRKEFNKAKNV